MFERLGKYTRYDGLEVKWLYNAVSDWWEVWVGNKYVIQKLQKCDSYRIYNGVARPGFLESLYA